MKLKKNIKIDATNIDLETVVNNCIYSSEEKVIGKWLGKPLYRKTYNCGQLPNASQKQIDIDLNLMSGVIQIKHMYGYAYRSLPDLPMTYPLPNVSNSHPIWIYCGGDNSSDGFIRITTASDRSAFRESYITLEYIKTTD